MHGYLVNKAKELGVFVYALNGWTEHVHLIGAIPPKHSVSYVVKCLKGASSFDLNQSNVLDDHFAWQRGYGVLTLGESQLSRAEAYVNNQKKHHRLQTTNSWLERVDEFDEGPLGEGLPMDVVQPVLKEAGVIYVAEEMDFPF